MMLLELLGNWSKSFWYFWSVCRTPGDEWYDEWMDRYIDGWMDGWMDRWIDGYSLNYNKLFFAHRLVVLILFFPLIHLVAVTLLEAGVSEDLQEHQDLEQILLHHWVMSQKLKIKKERDLFFDLKN